MEYEPEAEAVPPTCGVLLTGARPRTVHLDRVRVRGRARNRRDRRKAAVHLTYQPFVTIRLLEEMVDARSNLVELVCHIEPGDPGLSPRQGAPGEPALRGPVPQAT